MNRHPITDPHNPPTFFAGGTFFPSIHDLLKRVQNILLNPPPAALPFPLAGDDLAVILDVYRLHPKAQTGRGVRGVSIVAIPSAKNGLGRIHRTARAFAVHLPCGTVKPFSFQKCIDASLGADCDMLVLYPKMLAKIALRCEIQPQIDAFRASLPLNIICPITNRRVHRNQTSIDHMHPNTFSALVLQWTSLAGVKLYNLKTSITEDFRALFVDRSLANSWTDYHRRHARLRALSRLANKALGNSESPVKDLAPKEGR